ncbi:class I SAM-dependent methyltransferase [Thaumasiovibrio subtropicus]|uniref:class I SAM-dependent methyltransferase n=1 Tax=Thaumasiovibrio subtropicus TaxID=1891207 RepID=UPI001FE34567|nr:class I SAM-dependent methyltransferase [Thaumasiovibrio subtropicus]
MKSKHETDEWFDKYIFPNGVIPSLSQISNASESIFSVEDLHHFGPCHDRTLCAWYDNFKRHYPAIKDKYNESFYRMWRYYLLVSAGAFRARRLSVFQLVMTKTGAQLPANLRVA